MCSPVIPMQTLIAPASRASAASRIPSSRVVTNAPPPALSCPRSLSRQGYALRDERDDDTAFLQILYASTRADEMAAIDAWTASQAGAFLNQQYAAQRHHYRTQIGPCRFLVIDRHGEPVGRLYHATRQTQLRVVDIALMPAEQGMGVGTSLIEAVIEMANAAKKCVGIFVDKGSRALDLYRRLGFEPIGETAMHIEMERAVGPPVSRTQPRS